MLVLMLLCENKMMFESVFWKVNGRLNSHDKILSNIGGKTILIINIIRHGIEITQQ